MKALVPPTTDILRESAESAVACAQSTLQQAMNATKVTPRELARRMGVHREFVRRMMTDGMTIAEFGWALAECGFRPSFTYEPITSRWNPDALEPTKRRRPPRGRK